MGFLSVFGAGFINPRRIWQVSVAMVTGNDPAHGGDRLLAHLHAIGSHIGDQTNGFTADINALIQALRDPHGPGCPKSELAGCFLLQG